jgi:hypothetical protein
MCETGRLDLRLPVRTPPGDTVVLRQYGGQIGRAWSRVSVEQAASLMLLFDGPLYIAVLWLHVYADLRSASWKCCLASSASSKSREEADV